MVYNMGEYFIQQESITVGLMCMDKQAFIQVVEADMSVQE